jgi:hypothetical protein
MGPGYIFPVSWLDRIPLPVAVVAVVVLMAAVAVLVGGL